MTAATPPQDLSKAGPIVVVGAGIGGLAAALPLAHAGADITILDRAEAPGGKMRRLNGVDAGPTVLTMRDVFDDLFAAAGERLDDHVKLVRQEVLARHWWPDSGPLDLYNDPARNIDAIGDFAGPKAARQFRRFAERAKRLFDGFHAPVMTAPTLGLGALTGHVMSSPRLAVDMAPVLSLAQRLALDFSDPRLRQLFGRYATYVGGSPYQSPALLSLIWEAEARGVWCVRGGMHNLACAIADLIAARGGKLRFGTHVRQILTDSDGVTGVALSNGTTLPARHVIFNGDPRALASGLLGADVRVAPQTLGAPRSLSATVWAFRSAVSGPELAHHNVFFCNDPRDEFGAIAKGQLPEDATLYVCAEDRGQGIPVPQEERFEIIRNAPPLTTYTPPSQEYAACHTRTFRTLERFGLSFTTEPGPEALTTPRGFETLFPGSAGSLYGQSPHGMTAALARPTARTAVRGLILCGGGCHPGAGVPMSALSGRHAAEAILMDHASTLRSRQTDTRGGISMASRTAAPVPSRSSPS